MKEKLTLKNIILLAVAGVAFIVFCLSFAIPLRFTTAAESGRAPFIIWGCSKLVANNGQVMGWNDLFGIERMDPNFFGLFGVILALLAAIALVLAVFVIKNEKVAKIIILVCAGVLLLSGIFQFLLVSGFKASLVNPVIRKYGESIRAELEKEVAYIQSYFRLSAGSIICGIVTILAAAAAGVSPFLPAKK